MKTDNESKTSAGKTEIILKAAQQRLGLYGYEKTTMKEIADDVAMSKASLYYYYPDKEGLFKAVIEKEQEDFFAKIEEKSASLPDPEEMLEAYVKLRIGYFREFMNLSKFRSTEHEQVKPILRALFDNFRAREKMILVKVLASGKQSGKFHFEDEQQLAEMFLDILKGLRFTLIKQRPFVELAAEEFQLMEKASANFTRLFIRGLKYQETTKK